MICEKCGKECMVELDDSRECPQCGSVYCSAKCAKWKEVDGESICLSCYIKRDDTKDDDTSQQTFDRWDLVDNTIFEMLKKLNPTDKELKWKSEIIDVRNAICKFFVNEFGIDDEDFYP